MSILVSPSGNPRTRLSKTVYERVYDDVEQEKAPDAPRHVEESAEDGLVAYGPDAAACATGDESIPQQTGAQSRG